jgi:hypothetical protein
MLGSKTPTLEDQIVVIASNAKVTAKSLHVKLGGEEKLSLRAVYKAIDKLIAAGVVLKVGKQILIDQEWLGKTQEMLGSTSMQLLSGGERVVYTFVSVEHLDAFWKTVVLPMEQSASNKEILFYNPHNFWAYLPARKESEDAYYRHFSAAKRYGFFTVGAAYRADKEFKREYQGEHLQIDLRNIGSFRETEHVTIIGTFIVTVRLSKRVAQEIDKLYASEKSMPEMLPKIIQICHRPGKIRFVIENNEPRALKLKRVLAKNFYFKGPS